MCMVYYIGIYPHIVLKSVSIDTLPSTSSFFFVSFFCLMIETACLFCLYLLRLGINLMNIMILISNTCMYTSIGTYDTI